MTAALVVLAVAVIALSVDRVLTSRQHANEVHALIDDNRVANRNAVRAAMARSGLDYDRAESFAAIIDQRGAVDPGPHREPPPAPEGLG